MGKQWRGAGDWAFELPRSIGDVPAGAEMLPPFRAKPRPKLKSDQNCYKCSGQMPKGSRLVLWDKYRKAWRHAASAHLQTCARPPDNTRNPGQGSCEPRIRGIGRISERRTSSPDMGALTLGMRGVTHCAIGRVFIGSTSSTVELAFAAHGPGRLSGSTLVVSGAIPIPWRR
jgi:hypothetical protein